jgi:S1-C subfamily serine protease
MSITLGHHATIYSILLTSVFGFAQLSSPQVTESVPQTAKLTIKSALITNDLTVRTVPKLALIIEPEAGAPVSASTNFEGNLTVDIPLGKYRLRSTHGVDFENKHFDWDISALAKSGENQLELSSDNAKITTSDKPSRVTDALATQYKRLQNSVVTVWSEFGHGTGFIVDPAGLILTNQHVLGPTSYIAVQFDSLTKVPAVKLLADPQKDVAVIWVDLSAFPKAISAPLASASPDQPTAEEGERVFTIGSPLTQQKIITTGIVSKVEPHAIISDIRIDHGNSGGPLFNSLGEVIGITTFVDQGPKGGGIAGIVRIEEAARLLSDARAKMAMVSRPLPILLPVEPDVTFPIDAIKETLLREKFDAKHYSFRLGDFEVALITPPLRYRMEGESQIKAAKEKEKRTRKSEQAVQGTFRPLDDLKNWEEYVGNYKPIIMIRATPKLHETGGSIARRSLIAGLSQGGYGGAATIRFKTDFYRMTLKCGEKEIVPIQPGKIAHVLDTHNLFVNATDATYEGFYLYPPDSISPSCGRVTLGLYSEKNPETAATKDLDEKTVAKIWGDFEPYRNSRLSFGAPVSSTAVVTEAKLPTTPVISADTHPSPQTNPQRLDNPSSIPTKAAVQSSEVRPSVLKIVAPSPTSETALSSQAIAETATEGTASVTSDPDGADIFIDSVGHGRTPALLRLKPGRHSVQVVHSGYKDWVSEVEVKTGSIVNITASLQK